MAAKTNVVNLTRAVQQSLKPEQLQCLYIPVNSIGSSVDPKKAIRLECWKYTGVPRQQPYVASSFKYALSKLADTEDFTLLKDTYPLLEDGIAWLMCIHRHPDGDVINPKYITSKPAKETIA